MRLIAQYISDFIKNNFLIILVMLLGVSILTYKSNRLKIEGELTSGQVRGGSLPMRNTPPFIDYEFMVNDKVFKSSNSTETFSESLIFKQFPVIYVRGNPEISHMLIYPNDFKKYGYEFPDSLTQVLELIK